MGLNFLIKFGLCLIKIALGFKFIAKFGWRFLCNAIKFLIKFNLEFLLNFGFFGWFASWAWRCHFEFTLFWASFVIVGLNWLCYCLCLIALY